MLTHNIHIRYAQHVNIRYDAALTVQRFQRKDMSLPKASGKKRTEKMQKWQL